MILWVLDNIFESLQTSTDEDWLLPLRLNMAPFGVKVLCIEPGFFKTNVTDAAILSKNVKSVWDKMPQEVRDDYGQEYLQKCKFGLLKCSLHFEKLFHRSFSTLYSVSTLNRQSCKAVRRRPDEGG